MTPPLPSTTSDAGCLARLLRGLPLLLLSLLAVRAHAQDIIIKNNKEEIKAKVLEIEETTVKYKLFDFQDGPSYVIRKNEVFMIMYKNGRREIFDEGPAPAPAPTRTDTAPGAAVSVLGGAPAAPEKPTKFNYDPLRLLMSHTSEETYGGEFSATSVYLLTELKLVPGWLNFGGGFWLSSVSASITGGDDISDTVFGSQIYLGGYVPLNHLMGKTASEYTGFFPYVHVGAAVPISGEGSSISGVYNFGVDYKFTPGFGLSIQTQRFETLGFGLTLFGNGK